MFRRRSSGSFGRIEIRSSSEDIQFIMLRNRSRLPLNRRKKFATQLDEPVTINRPAPLSPIYVPAAPNTNGPFWSLGPRLISAEVRLVVANAFSDVSNNFSTIVFPPPLRV